MVLVDKLTKVAHFIPIKVSHKEANIAEIYMKEISRLHGVPKIPSSLKMFGRGYLKYLGPI
jgi:hypothetical protein